AIADAAQASGTDPDRCSFSVALNAARDQIVQAQGVIADTVIDLVGTIGHAVLGTLMPARRTRLGPRAVKRPLSRYAYKSLKVDRHTYKATVSIDILTSAPGP
ncbi:transposase, partial [Streptomyces sp. NWU339]